jgi:hypothetical protein
MQRINTSNRPPAQALPPASAALSDLARQAREAHVAAGQAVCDAVCHALIAGKALIAAKALVPEGKWTHWVKKHCDFSDRHARRYIALAEAYEASGHTVSGDLLGLSLRGAIRKLTPPAERKPAHKAVRKAKPSGNAITGLDITAAWHAAPPAERVRAVNNIGLRPLLQAMPENWLPTLEHWVEERRSTATVHPPISIETNPEGYPPLPAHLCRALLKH